MPTPKPESKPTSSDDQTSNPSIHVGVQIFANLRDYTGYKRQSFDMEKESTIKALLLRIAAGIPRGAEFLDETTENNVSILKKYVKVILNGRILFTEQALETIITSIEGSDEAVVAIFPPVGGG